MNDERVFRESEVPAEGNANCHKEQVCQSERHHIFPLEGEQLVNSNSWESPLEPNDNKGNEECLPKEPHRRRNPIHNHVEAIPTGNMKRHPSTEEHQRSNAGNDEEVEIFGKIEETEVNT